MLENKSVWTIKRQQSWPFVYSLVIFFTVLILNGVIASLIHYHVYQTNLSQLLTKGKVQVARLAKEAVEPFLTVDRLMMSYLIETINKQDEGIRMTTLVNADGRVLVNSQSDLEGTMYRQKDNIVYLENKSMSISRCYIKDEECLDFSRKIELDKDIKGKVVLLGVAHIAYSIDSIKKLLYSSVWKSGLVVLGGSLLMFLISWSIFAAINRRLKEVKNKLEEIGRGRWDIEEHQENDDFGGLMHQLRSTESNLNDLIRRKIEKTKTEQNELTAYLIQSKYIPEGPPNIRDCDVGMFFQAGEQIGGDWLDFVKLDERHFGMVVADVVGQGISAAVMMNQVRAAFHSNVQNFISPQKTMVAINRQLYKDKQENYLVTMSYAVYDQPKSTVTYSRAGNVGAIIYRHETKTVEFEKPVGIAMGIAAPDTFELILTEKKLKLNLGDILLLYTDGVEKNYNNEHEFYDLERLKRIILKYAERRTKTLIKMIDNDIKQHLGREPLHDDIAIIAFKPEEASVS